jgi:nicotinate-nucleotide pyrophosphorylase (carboxylating)
MSEGAHKERAVDVPEIILKQVMHKVVRAEIVATEHGVVAGTEELESRARTLGLQVNVFVSSGLKIKRDQVVAEITGNPVQVVRGEDVLLGVISKVSGVATAAHEAVRRTGGIKVVCGGWKKMPPRIKKELRRALKAGGVHPRILPRPFLYLDKNYIRIFGSLSKALEATRLLPGRAVVAQLRGETSPIAEEALNAARYGAHVLMVDTGRMKDLRAVSRASRKEGFREQVQIAFAGGLTLSDLDNLRDEDVDIVDIGRAILDAPLLDFRLDVVGIGVNNEESADRQIQRTLRRGG